eukprot:CAMPEP_0178449304 /NCGR_PEP_ID=MMETSP0689_2-20121128/42471_1 /TAXON_ID=160604 /ORGANISM="Amphidinium massartii, Strain CS-259" /LENGTH=35 /DNA_ID= /DNA_START= /DNA_END= /DNA_ORIENTATION=
MSAALQNEIQFMLQQQLSPGLSAASAPPGAAAVPA